MLTQCGFEGDALDNALASVERYNELAKAGSDDDFGKLVVALDGSQCIIQCIALKAALGQQVFQCIGLELVSLGLCADLDVYKRQAKGSPVGRAGKSKGFD